jgi:Ni/Co efflux regulator RcnB
MRSRLFSLAALLMSGAASTALAQGQPQIQNGGPMWNAARQAQERQGQARQEQAQHPQGQRPPGPPPQGQPPHPGGQGGPQGWNGHHGGPGQAGPGQPGPGQPGPGRPAQPNPGQAIPDHRGPDRADRDHRDGGQRDRWDGDRRDHWDGDRGGDHRDWNRPGDHRGPDWNRYDRGGPPPRNAPRWAPRRYPPVYSSPSRYHGGYWRPPEGFYVRAWRYGEILPRGWYGPDYALFDWWSFGLPEPPPGYEWVRVGADALLIDDYGRIFQVVRAVFW